MWLMKLSGLIQIYRVRSMTGGSSKLGVSSHYQPSPINRSNNGISAINNKGQEIFYNRLHILTEVFTLALKSRTAGVSRSNTQYFSPYILNIT